MTTIPPPGDNKMNKSTIPIETPLLGGEKTKIDEIDDENGRNRRTNILILMYSSKGVQ